MRTKWDEQALPSVKAKWTSARSRTGDRGAEVAEDPQAAVTVSDDQRGTLSGAAAREWFAAAALARICSDGQLRLVRNARVVDEREDSPVKVGTTVDIMPQRIGKLVTLMLEADPSLLCEDFLAEPGTLVASMRADGGHGPTPRGRER
jgi:hypothetical protein